MCDEWKPISEARRKAGIEIIGIRAYGGKVVREPFITFWSPTLGKFYCDPTHWIPWPKLSLAAAHESADEGGQGDD